jgi:glycine/D-amino acid oxidase-like deaminating enzyme
MDIRSGYPLSLIKYGLVADYPKLEKDIKTDVVVMGGGISGALTAYFLMLNNISCIVVDARSIGLGSTCASTSLLQYEIDIPLHQLIRLIGNKKAVRSYWLCKEAIDKLLLLGKSIGFDGIKKKKSLYYAAYKKDKNFLQEEFAARKKYGFRVSYLEAEDLFLKTGINAPAAILSDDAAQTDAYLLTHHLHNNNRDKGLEVFDRTTISKIIHHKRSVEMKTNEGFVIHCKKLVYATGYEVVQYIDKPIVKLLSTYAVASESLSPSFTPWKKNMLLWNTAHPYLYLRTTSDNRVIIGGRDEEFYSPAKRDALIKKKTKKLTADFRKLFPDVPFVPEFSWTGTFGSTKDGLPYIGTYKKLPNSYFALGFGGNGITFSIIAAEIISKIIKGIRCRDEEVFSFER